MAKYRITGVPPFREGGPKRKSKEQVTVSNWDSPVGPVNYNPASLSNFINNTPLVNQPDTYTIDPMYQGVGYQPTSDQITERLFNKVYAPELETKDGFYEPTLPEECSPGTVLYKGECIDESRYYTLLAKDTKLDFDRKYDEIYANVDARLLDQEASENADKQFQAAWEEKYHKYKEDALKKGNKHKKLKPFATFTQDQYDNQVLPAMAQNSNAFAEYYMEKGSDGKINLYPRNVINHLIYDHGVRSGEFKKYHGLNADNIQKEFGDMIAFADYHYKINVSKELRKKISSGLSAEEARKELEKEGWGTADGLTTNFKDLSDQLDAQLNSDMYFTDDNGVMYKKDAKGNVFQYTSRNQWNNNEFSIWNDKSNFKNDYENKFTWNFEWKPIDKSAYKEDVYGNVTINNNNVGFFDSRFANRKNENPEETILNNYEKAVNSTFKEDDKIRTVNNTQNTYTSLNNQLFDHVYGSNWSTGLPQIDPLINGVTPEYAEAYNKAINEINAITEKEIDMGMDVNPAGITVKDYKDVSGNPDYFQKQKAKILEDFNNKANKLNFKVEGTDISLGNMSSDFMAPKNIEAYKDPDAFKFQKDNVINQEANDYLKLMFSHNILPTEENVMDTEGYRGEQDKSLAQQYGNFGVFSNSPEAQSFLQKYRNQPSYGQTLFDEAYQNKALNLFEDKSKKELEDAKLLQKRAQDKMMMYPELLGLDQLASLVNQPLNTLEKWTSGEWQDPGVGLMSDNGTEHEADKWSQAYGPGGRQLFYNKFNELNENPIGQTINLFNPLHWAAQTGTTAHLKFRQNDPEIGYSDVGLNALFAFAPYSKALRAASGTKLLPKVGALSGVRDYQIARNLATPGNALTGYFGTEAFNLDPDHPGFAIEAGKNIYEGIKEGDTKKISQNILPLGMGLMIGTHGYQNLRDAGKLSTPSLFNIHPTTFDRMYYAPKPPLQKNGGELPKGKYGRITKESKEISKDPIKIEDKTPELPLFFESRPTNALNQFITGTNPVVNSNKYSELFKKIARPEASPTQLSIPFPETLSTRTDLNERVPAILPNISESVVPPTGLNLNVTANPNSPFYKAINPKTGKINFDQAISILSKSAGGDEVIHSLFSNPELWQGLGPNVLHMDAKDLLSNVQQAIPSLSRTEVPFDFKEGTFERNDVFNIPRSEYVSTPFTTYGLDNIYPEMFQNLTRDYSPSLLAKEQRLQTYLNKIDARLENEQNKFNEVAARDPDEYGSIWYGPEGGASQYYIQTEKLDAINAEIEKLKNKKESVLSNPEKFKDFQIINPRTIQFSNLNELGYGLKQHGNPSETLAHSHVYEDAYEPDALYISQIQSDASEHYSKMKQRHQKPSNATDTELDLENYMPEFEAQSIGQYFSPETHWSNDVVENLPEESIEVIKRNLPQKRVLMTNKKSTEKRLIQEMLQYAAQQGKKYIYIPTSELSTKIQNNDKASKIYDSYKKHYSKLFGESGIGNHTDQFGNNWLRLNVPESYSKGEGVIEAYKDGGVSMQLSQSEIDQYIKDGYIIEDE